MTDTTTDPFDDIELGEKDILGTRTFEDTLYSVNRAEKQAPVDVLKDEKACSIPSVEYARSFAERSTRDDGHAYVAIVQSTEQIVESQSNPLMATVCYDSKVVSGPVVGRDDVGLPEYKYDGYALEQTYRAAAHESDSHEVFMEEADYETGSVTITVHRV